MTSAAPTILALETDSAWVVILAVSLVTLPATLLLRRLIGRPGGVASGILLGLPLVLPLVAAFLYESAALPEIAVLRPVSRALEGKPDALLHLLLVSDGSGRLVTPYAISGSAGPWLMIFGAIVVSFMLIRRLLGTLVMQRIVVRCRPLAISPRAAVVHDVAIALAHAARMKRVPEILVLPQGVPGVFVAAGGGGRILICEELLEQLDDEELAAILAHEFAHLEAKDLPLVVAAGLLRDIVAWNPLAHFAFRRLANDRELEADRRAAEITGEPLALASGLLKVCELLRGSRRLHYRAAISALRPGGRVTMRVTRLIALADGPPVNPRPASGVPYVMAAALVAVLGLQFGARITGDEPSALALVLGDPAAAETSVWSADGAPKKLLGKANGERQEPSKGRPGNDARTGGRGRGAYVVRQRDLARWSKSIGLDRRRGIPLHQDWSAVPVFSQAGSIGLYRMEPKTLFEDPGTRQAAP